MSAVFLTLTFDTTIIQHKMNLPTLHSVTKIELPHVINIRVNIVGISKPDINIGRTVLDQHLFRQIKNTKNRVNKVTYKIIV